MRAVHNDFGRGERSGVRERLLSPLSLAAYIAWLAVAAQTVDLDELRASDPRQWAGTAALAVILLLFAMRAMRDTSVGGASFSDHVDGVATGAWNPIAQGALVVLGDALLRNGQVVILLIVVAGQLVLILPVRRAIAWILGFNLGIAAVWFDRSGSISHVLAMLAPILGFQAFAGITGHYAGTSERGRERLAQVNAELLATQCLLEESARGGERLKLSRELHDVAGHKLTALKLNLARLMRDPALAAREELQVSRQMADELLDDIRAVVSELRAHDGLDLRAALQALARPVAGTRIVVEVEDGLRVDDLAQAEALLRCAQESITNALRHGHASHIEVSCTSAGDGIDMQIRNDGIAPTTLAAGNGLTGMRERLEELGGELEVTATAPRGVKVHARLPTARA